MPGMTTQAHEDEQRQHFQKAFGGEKKQRIKSKEEYKKNALLDVKRQYLEKKKNYITLNSSVKKEEIN